MRLVRIYNQRMEKVAVHVRAEPGRFSTHASHIASEKISIVERGAGALLRRASLIGPHTSRWAAAMMEARGVQGLRVLQGLLSMAGRHRTESIEEACELALTHGAFRLRALRVAIKRSGRQQTLPFAQEHPLIRPLEHYGRLMTVSLREDVTTKERGGRDE